MFNKKQREDLSRLFSQGHPVGLTSGLLDFLKNDYNKDEDFDDDDLDDDTSDGNIEDEVDLRDAATGNAKEETISVAPRNMPPTMASPEVLYSTKTSLDFWNVAWTDLRAKLTSGAIDSSDSKILLVLSHFVFHSPLIMRPDLAREISLDFKNWQKTKSLVPSAAIDEMDPLGQVENDFVNGVIMSDWVLYAQKNPNLFARMIDDILPRNKEIYRDLAKIIPAPNFEHNISWFLEGAGITDNQAKSMGAVLRLLMAEHFKISQAFIVLEEKHSANPQVLSEMIDRMLDIPVNTTMAVFKAETGVLARKGLALFEHGFRESKPFSTAFGKLTVRDFVPHYTDKEDFRQYIVSESSAPLETNLHQDVTEQSFSHLGQDVANLIVALRQPNPMKILITGAPGSGKSALLSLALRMAGRTGMTCRDGDFDAYTIERIRNFSSTFGNSVLVIEDAENFEQKDLGSLLKTNSRSSEIWTLPTSALLQQSVISGFDMVIDIPSFPLELREELSEKLFSDPETQKKVARICSTPGEIKRIHGWSVASGQEKWKDLSVVANNILQASVKARASSIGKALPIQLFQPSALSSGFEDVVGYDHIVKQAKKMIAGYKNAAQFRELGARPPKGVLMSGGPGLGKTHLVRAMAQEAGVPLLVAGSAAMAGDPELISAVFAEARRQSPCVLFLDELDALGASGKKMDGTAESPERQGILNRLLTEIDGFDGLSDVLVVGATHRAEVLDDALTRSGRLGWNIQFNLPDLKARTKIWQYYAKDKKIDQNIDWTRVARMSANMSPADINEASKAAALNAAFAGKKVITQKDMEEAIDQIQWGASDENKEVVREELHRTAVHEAGHAVVSFLLNRPIERITVKPRQDVYGFVQHVHDETKNYATELDVEHIIKILYAGRVAEEVCLQSRSRGASSDLDKIRRYLSELIRDEGMGELKQGVNTIGVSQEALRKAEEDENRISLECYEGTTHLITTHRHVVQALADTLMEERELGHDEVIKFFKDQGVHPEGQSAKKDKRQKLK